MGQGLVQVGVVWHFPGKEAGRAGALSVCFVVLGVLGRLSSGPDGGSGRRCPRMF